MPSQPDPAEQEYTEIAESVKSGEYFRKARAMYDLSVHDLMTERYLYICITALSVLIFIITFGAMQALYPLSTPVPFIFTATDIVDDIPVIHPLGRRGEDPDQALLKFFVQNYVTMREEYDITRFDRDVNGVSSQSAPTVLAEFQHSIDPRNPDSPLTLYQRFSTRRISIMSSKILEGRDEVEVTYEATVTGKGATQKSRWQANIAFKYSGLALDEKTEKIKPVSFAVTRYSTKRLQDIR